MQRPFAVDGLSEILEALFPVKKFTCESDIGFAYDLDRKSKEVVRLNLTAGHFSRITPKQAQSRCNSPARPSLK